MANYRQLTASGLGTSASCPQCYTTLSLCYSALSATDLCCNNPQSVFVYVPAGETFATATTLYSDTGLTQVASAGWYSDDTNNCIGGTP